MFHIILYQPEIPPNTGNIIRLSANVGACLHLIEPLGFSITDKTLKRAGMDYRNIADVRIHPNWESCRNTLKESRLFAFTTKAVRRFDRVVYRCGDAFVFGPETRGLPDTFLELFSSDCRLRIPMRSGCRSMNLANSVAVAVYEAWRQHDFLL